MREAGIEVNDTPKIQVSDPEVKDHSLYFKNENMRIPLALNGIFSYFNTTKPTDQTMNDCEDVLMLTPSRWNPHDFAYQQNEDQMLDWKGELSDPKHRQRILLEEIPEMNEMADASFIGSVETSAIHSLLKQQTADGTKPLFNMVPSEIDEVASVLVGINPIYDDNTLHNRLDNRTNLSKFQMSIGSTTATCGQHVMDDVDLIGIMHSPTIASNYNGYTIGSMAGSTFNTDVHDAISPHASLASTEGSQVSPSTINTNIDGNLNVQHIDPNIINANLLDDLFQQSLKGDIDIDDIMVSGMHAGKYNGIKPEHLSKIWHIDVDTARKTLDVTSQRSVRSTNPKLSRNY